MKKLLILVAGGVGYVFGTKAGRERYEQIRAMFNKVKDDPRVQEKAQQAADLAKEKAPVVKDKLTSAASSAASSASGKVKSGVGTDSSDSGNSGSASVASSGLGTPAPAEKLNPESTIFQENDGPQGDLP